GNTRKAKWYYGFHLVPLSRLDPSAKILQHPSNTTECPYLAKESETTETTVAGKKRDTSGREDGEPGNYMWSNETQAKENDTKRRKKIPPEGYVCNICKTPGHWIQECPENKSIKVPGPEYICKICGEKGHYISDCKNKKIAKRDCTRLSKSSEFLLIFRLIVFY
ncbi:1894_t:CDS:2, partial [Paraglomus occultum]